MDPLDQSLPSNIGEYIFWISMKFFGLVVFACLTENIKMCLQSKPQRLDEIREEAPAGASAPEPGPEISSCVIELLENLMEMQDTENKIMQSFMDKVQSFMEKQDMMLSGMERRLERIEALLNVHLPSDGGA